MSRYGKIPIPLVKGVEITLSGLNVKVKGPKGELVLPVKEGVKVVVEDSQILVDIECGSGLTSAMHGLYRSLINNMVVGVSAGFEKRLNMIGVGYRAAIQGNLLDLQVGFSHPTKLEVPSSLNVTVDKSTTIIIQGIDKQLVGQFAAIVRSKRPPEPYKGKGIRYENEYVRKKAGKASK
ncbi:MAG: 50S ribosomal protein L6 [Chlamydiae bacterium]|nr:50S ribosomal protein L6 [Chlamydiota bacterium]